MARTFKARYYPRGSIHTCSPKPHQSWVWRNIIKSDNPKLKEGRWWVNKGLDIPLRDNEWFRCKHNMLNIPFIIDGAIADLINQKNHSWNADLVRAYYPFPTYEEIMKIPLPKINAGGDKLLWKHSKSGDFEVKTAYRLLLKNCLASSNDCHRVNLVDSKIWALIWKIKLPQKICTFIWKLLCSFLKLRGISDEGLCPMCNYEEESASHLFLLCPFARACWHGSSSAVHTSDFSDISVQQRLINLINALSWNEEGSFDYMQSIFTTLWTTWLHRNTVVHEGKQPNPIEVILTAQTLSYRYKEAFSSQYNLLITRSMPSNEPSNVTGQWQLLIKIAGTRNPRLNRSAWAFEAKDPQGVIKFYGVHSSNASTIKGTVQEALLEAVFTVRNHGFTRILILTNSKDLIELVTKSKKPTWHERSLIADLDVLSMDGLVYKLLEVPRIVIDFVYNAATIAVRMPIHNN